MPWALLVAGSAQTWQQNVAVAEPTMTGRVIAAWPSFSLIAAYELLMRQVRRAADSASSERPARRSQARQHKRREPVPPATWELLVESVCPPGIEAAGDRHCRDCCHYGCA